MENRGRLLVQYSAYKFDAAWRRQSDEQRAADKEAFAAAVEQAADEMTVRSYSLPHYMSDKLLVSKYFIQ